MKAGSGLAANKAGWGDTIGARKGGILTVRLGDKIRLIVGRMSQQFYMSESEFVRLAVMHYVRNHVDERVGASLIIQEPPRKVSAV